MVKEYEKSRAAKILGKSGGLKGGPARAAKLTPSQRTKIATEGGKARQSQKRASGHGKVKH